MRVRQSTDPSAMQRAPEGVSRRIPAPLGATEGALFETLPAADRFSVYIGDIGSLRADRDFTRVVPVDCAVPDAGMPRAGDFLSVLDTLPDPVPGQGSYVIIGLD